MKTLWELQEHQTSRVAAFAEGFSPAYAQRLKELGFTEGTEITCIKTTPFGAPRVYGVQDAVYTLEKEAALLIEID